MLWTDFYDSHWDWADSTKRTKISSLEDIGSGEEIVEVVYEINDPKIKAQMIRKAMKLGAKFTSDDLLALEGELPAELCEQLAQYCGFDSSYPFIDENDLSWDDFYCYYADWDETTLARRIEKLHEFGESGEVMDAIQSMPSDKLENRLYEKAIAAGVKFTEEEKLSMRDFGQIILDAVNAALPTEESDPLDKKMQLLREELQPVSKRTKGFGAWLSNLFKKKTEAKTKTLDRPPLDIECLDDSPSAIKMAEAARYFEMFQESIDLISKTVYCQTFFYRYGFALENAQNIIRLSKGLKNEKAALEMRDILIREKANIVNDFLFRCYDAGKIQYVKKDIVPYLSELPPESKELLQTMLEYGAVTTTRFQRNSCAGLFALFAAATLITGLIPENDHSRRCNGDCDHCPPHYGYRYGRWYYGHGHQRSCERGGNGGASGRTYRD